MEHLRRITKEKSADPFYLILNVTFNLLGNEKSKNLSIKN